MKEYTLLKWNKDDWRNSRSKINIIPISSWFIYCDFRISVGVSENNIYLIESGDRKCWILEEVLNNDTSFIEFINKEYPGLMKIYINLIKEKNKNKKLLYLV